MTQSGTCQAAAKLLNLLISDFYNDMSAFNRQPIFAGQILG